MNGPLVAAAITTAAALLVLGPVVRRLSPGQGWLAWAFVVALPLQPLVFFFVRLPVHRLLAAELGVGPALTTISLFYAPLTEEPAKWLVLLIPAIRRRLAPDNAVALALATGLGFGVGEIWLIAAGLARQPDFAALPFWTFGGFAVERLLVCFVHGATVAFAFARLAAGRTFWPGALLGIALHFALNLPIVLIGIDPFGLGEAFWRSAVFFWLVAMAAGLVAALTRMTGAGLRRAMLGEATCQSCGTRYERPWLALNLGWKRFERCPACGRWHLT